MVTAQQKKAKELMAAVNKAMGKDALQIASGKTYQLTYIPTGLLPLDLLMNGGMPRGRFVEMYGDYSTLKSYIGLNLIKQTQMMGGSAAVIDTEHAFDEDWAKEIGVDTNSLLISRPETGEEGITAAEVLTRGGIDFILFDSIAATMPQDEQGKRMDQDKVQPGRQAALMSAAMRRLTAANKGTAILWINQTRLKIGVSFGSPESFPGGRAMAYYASHRIKMSKIGNEHQTIDVQTGSGTTKARQTVAQHFKAEVTKSKLSRPFRDTYFTWNLLNAQLDLAMFLVNSGYDIGAVIKKGNSWSFAGESAVGRQNFIDLVAGTPTLERALENRLRAEYGLSTLPDIKPKRTLRKVIKK